MAFDKKITTIFIITSIVAAGTALATVMTTNTTTKTLFFGDNPVVSTTTSTSTVGDAKSAKTEVTVTAKDVDLASVIMRILGIEVSAEEVSTLKARNMGNGEITLAYNLAHASGKSVQEILEMRYEQKMGWGKIANTLGVKLHDAEDRSVAILREAQLSEDADKLKIDIQIDDEYKDKHTNNAADNNNHKPAKMDDHNKPHKDQDKGHGKN
jgi:hypothetical protein